MPAWTIERHGLRNAAETLLLAAVGALFFVWVNFPAGLICGSMVAVATAALAGRPMVVPGNLAKLTFFVIGISLGANVSPRTLHGIVDWPASMILISVSA